MIRIDLISIFFKKKKTPRGWRGEKEKLFFCHSKRVVRDGVSSGRMVLGTASRVGDT